MDERKAFTSQFCPQYNTQVEFLMETSLEAGRTLIARYEIGGRDDLPMVDGRREFSGRDPRRCPIGNQTRHPLG
jgi:hypothetical protein